MTQQQDPTRAQLDQVLVGPTVTQTAQERLDGLLAALAVAVPPPQLAHLATP